MKTCLERIQSLAHQAGVPFETQRHREVYTAQQVAAELHEKGAHVAKVVIVEADEMLAMLVLAASAHVDFERAKTALSARHVHAAPEHVFRDRFPDCVPGAMPPFGRFYDMRTLIDEGLAHTTTLVFQAGTHRDTLKMATTDYLRLAVPEVASFTFAPEHVI
jgi:Ala-tRNA(Pro) deacylase